MFFNVNIVKDTFVYGVSDYFCFKRALHPATVKNSIKSVLRKSVLKVTKKLQQTKTFC